MCQQCHNDPCVMDERTVVIMRDLSPDVSLFWSRGNKTAQMNAGEGYEEGAGHLTASQLRAAAAACLYIAEAMEQ